MKNPAIVLFDAVGTVIEPVPNAVSVYQSLGRTHGSHLPHDTIRQNFQTAFQQVFVSPQIRETSNSIEHNQWADVVSRVFTDLENTDDLFLALWNHFAEPGNWRIFDDVQACWEELRRNKIAIGLASNFDERLMRICSTHEFEAINHIFYSGEIGFRKPDERFFKAVEKQLNLHASHIVMVGDDLENDVFASGRCGWTSFQINRSENVSDPFGLSSLTDLPSRFL